MSLKDEGSYIPPQLTESYSPCPIRALTFKTILFQSQSNSTISSTTAKFCNRH